jgi:predicted O-methyltransferase YrrM
MNELYAINPPATLTEIERDSETLGFSMASDFRTGALLRTLATAKPNGSFLEIGTGTGISTAWILDGMSQDATLLTIDNDDRVAAIASKYLGHDPRVRFQVGDGLEFLDSISDQRFDFIFADSWPGKYDELDKALRLLKPGGLYLIDDMLPQPNWPEGHEAKAERLIQTLEANEELRITKLNWSSGLIVATKRV